MVHQVEGGARTAAAGFRVGLEARPPRRHERVFGRDEDRVPEHEQEDREDAEGVAQAPLSGAWVLEGSSSKLARSIGNGPAVIARCRCARRSSSTSRSRWESVSATAKRLDAGFSSAPKRSSETS